MGEVNADGSPVTFAQQQAGIVQHSEKYGRHPRPSNGRRSLQQTGSFATGTTPSQNQPIVVDMTHSALQESMLGHGPPDAGINSGGGGGGKIAHIDNDGGAAVVVPVPKTPAAPAKVAGGAAKQGRKLHQSGSFGTTASQNQPIVVDMTHSALEASMLGNGPPAAGIRGGGGNIAHIDNEGGAAVVVPVPKTPAAPAKVAGGAAKQGRKLQQSGSFGTTASQNQPIVVDMTHSALEASTLGNGPPAAGIRGGGGGNIAHIDNEGGAAVVVPVPKTPAAPAKVAGGSVAAGQKPSGRRMLQQGSTGTFSTGGTAGKSPVVPNTPTSPAAKKLPRG